MTHAYAQSGLAVPAPPLRGPVRLAFVGQSTYFEACALADERPDVETTFLEFRGGGDAAALLDGLEDFAPHVVTVFRPETIPAGLLHDFPAITLGFLTEPLPRGGGRAHADLEVRLSELREVDAGNFDRHVCFDPLSAGTAATVLPIWRSAPLPVADRYFAPVRPIRGRPRVLFVGYSTEYRERMLVSAKHDFDVLHLAFGAGADELGELLASHDVGINIHYQPYPTFENRVAFHLAAGHLVLSEPLSPQHGLEPGIDFLQVDSRDGLHHALWTLTRAPAVWDRVRIRGRRKAELFRASRVWPRLAEDVLRDVAAFGTPRRRSA